MDSQTGRYIESVTINSSPGHWPPFSAGRGTGVRDSMSGLNCTRLGCKGEDGWFRRPFIRTNRHNRNRAIVNSHSGSVSFAVNQPRGGLAATNAAGLLPSGP